MNHHFENQDDSSAENYLNAVSVEIWSSKYINMDFKSI